jgi:hypothetical protein
MEPQPSRSVPRPLRLRVSTFEIPCLGRHAPTLQARSSGSRLLPMDGAVFPKIPDVLKSPPDGPRERGEPRNGLPDRHRTGFIVCRRESFGRRRRGNRRPIGSFDGPRGLRSQDTGAEKSGTNLRDVVPTPDGTDRGREGSDRGPDERDRGPSQQIVVRGRRPARAEGPRGSLSARSPQPPLGRTRHFWIDEAPASQGDESEGTSLWVAEIRRIARGPRLRAFLKRPSPPGTAGVPAGLLVKASPSSRETRCPPPAGSFLRSRPPRVRMSGA